MFVVITVAELGVTFPWTHIHTLDNLFIFKKQEKFPQSCTALEYISFDLLSF